VLDLFSDDDEVIDKTAELLNKVFSKTRKIAQLMNFKGKPKVVVNCGGHTTDMFQTSEVIDKKIQNLSRNIKKVNFSGCRFLAQTMPPYPWHFGGQSFHNQFTSAENILKILKLNQQLELCLDISHSYMWCNHSKENFEDLIKKIAPKVSHVHISDAAGDSEEGLQVGEGTLDFAMILKAFEFLPHDATLLPEIWQGHDNLGKGFKTALERLHKLGY
jgi:N-acetylneuraminate synthase